MPSPIEYPYMPVEGTIRYVSDTDRFMQAAFTTALELSLDETMPTGSVIVKEGKVIGRGANGSVLHMTDGCERKRLNMPTGQGYELCEGCSPKNHSEPQAIENARCQGNDTDGAELYLWGHWWCCKDCWNAMLEAGITKVVLLEESWTLYNRDVEGNIVGTQVTEFMQREATPKRELPIMEEKLAIRTKN